MSDTFDWKECLNLLWTTDLPCVGMERKSPVFLVRGIGHYFSLCRNDYNFYLKLRLTDEASRSHFRPISATVYAELKKAGSPHRIYQPNSISFDLDSQYICFGQPSHADQLSGNMGTFFFIFNSSDQKKLPEEKANEKSVQTSNVIGSRPCLEYLSDDFSKLLAEDEDHDMVLKCGGRVIQAHKTVLRARSSVFAAMLKSDRVEGRTGLLQIQDIDEDTLQAFVGYLYSGTLPGLSWGSAVKLCTAGDQYAVEGLKKRCAIFLVESLTTENACECLAQADAHNDSELKECVIPYVFAKGVPLLAEQWLPFVRKYP